ncbi:MAG: hypothetical protein J6Y75_07045 [Spirochaetaceae bacterium]|nr:hypothetical protein [Spirochaetaceae bacterium]
MKKAAFLMLVLFCFASSLHSQDELFLYDSSKIKPQTMYSYFVASSSGNKKMNFYFYVKDEKTTYSYFDGAEAINEVLVGENEFNTDFFCYSHTKTTNPFAYTEKPNIKNTMECFYECKNKSLVITNSVIGPYSQPMTYTITGDLKLIPCYEISNYQTDFWLAMRFYKGDFSDFKTGTINLPYTSVSNVSYAGVEKLGDVLCDRWEICQFDKRGKPSHENQICWFSKEDGYYTLVKYQCNSKAIFPENIVITLENVKSCTPEEWKEFVNNYNKNLKSFFESEE